MRSGATFDVIVAGLGAAGSSTAYHLNRQGAKVLGLERFGPTHERGSSHGRSRIYRTAYFEGEFYLPMLRRAQRLWTELERRSGESIVRPTGCLVIGPPGSPYVEGAARTARAFLLPHERLDASAVERRFPAFVLGPDEVALLDPNAGVLAPEAALRAHVAGAVEGGAELHYGEPIVRWTSEGTRIRVRTASGEYRARALVLAVGAWTSQFAFGLRLPLEVERQFVLWFPPNGEAPVDPAHMPVFVWDREPLIRTYGIPDLGEGVKVGAWNGRVVRSPDVVDRRLRTSEARPVREFVARAFRGVDPAERSAVSCLFTNAPDHHFVIGRHPRRPNVIVLSPCSGHGFKFASVVGEIAGRLALGEAPGFDLSAFDPGRFQGIGARR